MPDTQQESHDDQHLIESVVAMIDLHGPTKVAYLSGLTERTMYRLISDRSIRLQRRTRIGLAKALESL